MAKALPTEVKPSGVRSVFGHFTKFYPVALIDSIFIS